ncbi:MAG TPA: RNA polymerase sigma factor [Lacibacter sp.]|nr:RNA polymerase sigma factor [Lacibacter sp.]HMO89363.1 RNA polymerase sigma factor [Lacibacter sp.]HMP87192.1 RNA polymerase sigma factor [Lacibacter sp.]
MSSESDILTGCLANDRKSQKLLYDTYAPRMYAVCLRYMGNADDAQDVLQDGFVKIFRNLGKFRSEGSFEGWLRRIFVNTAIEQLRRKKLNLSLSEKEEQVEYPAASAPDRLQEKDLLELVRKLSPGYRTIFNLYVVEGFGHKEIADMLHISEGTSKSQLARARMILQDKIRQQKT